MLKQIAAAVILAGLAAMPSSAAEQEIGTKDNGQIEFMTPSGNIGCLYTPEGGTDVYQPESGGAELICERVEPTYVTVVLGPEGGPVMIEDPGEQSCCGAENILQYGNNVDLEGNFTCAVATTGLTCTREDGVGFSVARAGIGAITGDDDVGSQDEDENEADDASEDE